MPVALKPRCQDCAPTYSSSHFQQKLRNRIENFAASLFPRKIFGRFEEFIHPYCLGIFLFITDGLGLLHETEITDDTAIHYRTRVIFNEAKKRGLKMKALLFLKYPSNLFTLYTDKGRHLFEGIPGIDPRKMFTRIEDKQYAREILGGMGIPTPQGQAFKKLKPALAYAHKIQGPWVVKPRAGSLSNHARVNLKTEQQLIDAIQSTLQVTNMFIVETFIEGELYRATTVGDKLIAVCRREPPRITGDGKHTVKELIKSFDQKRRQVLEQVGYKPHKIPPLPPVKEADMNRVLKSGEVFELTWKTNISHGGNVVDVTSQVHPDNREIFEAIATKVKIPAIGIDFISPDISKSWKDTRCGVIEINSLPSIDMHYPPIVQGETHDIAGKILDLFLSSY